MLMATTMAASRRGDSQASFDLVERAAQAHPAQVGPLVVAHDPHAGQLAAAEDGFGGHEHGRAFAVVAREVNPIEKKPLYHFHPGAPILSVAAPGCNLHCKNCQNWEISQANPEDLTAAKLLPKDVPALAKQAECRSVAYTYT